MFDPALEGVSLMSILPHPSFMRQLDRAQCEYHVRHNPTGFQREARSGNERAPQEREFPTPYGCQDIQGVPASPLQNQKGSALSSFSSTSGCLSFMRS